MAGGQGRSSPDRLPRGERTSPRGGARQWGEQGGAAQAFGTFCLLAPDVFVLLRRCVFAPQGEPLRSKV